MKYLWPTIRKADTPEAKKLWDAVERSAARCPERLRSRIERIAKERAHQVMEKYLDKACDEILRKHEESE